MAKSRRTFTKEFKQDVVRQSEHCEKITELAADLGLLLFCSNSTASSAE